MRMSLTQVVIAWTCAGGPVPQVGFIIRQTHTAP